MKELEQKISDGNLTQKDIVHLLLHNAQHMVTREEVKSDIESVEKTLKEDISKVETTLKADISKLDEKITKVETTLKADISKVETTLKADISRVETTLKADITTISAKFDKMQWLIIATMLTVLFKDYVISFLK